MKDHRREINRKLWEYGNRLDDCQRAINDCNMSINQLYNPLKATDYNGMPHGSGTSDATLETVQMIENYTKERNCLVRHQDKIKQEFEEYISLLKHQQKEVVRLRYIEGLKHHQISRRTNYSIKNVEILIAKSQDILYN